MKDYCFSAKQEVRGFATIIMSRNWKYWHSVDCALDYKLWSMTLHSNKSFKKLQFCFRSLSSNQQHFHNFDFLSLDIFQRWLTIILYFDWIRLLLDSVDIILNWGFDCRRRHCHSTFRMPKNSKNWYRSWLWICQFYY